MLVRVPVYPAVGVRHQTNSFQHLIAARLRRRAAYGSTTMYTWIKKTVDRPPVADASSLLTYLAGEFAPRVAGLWVAPHTAFLAAPVERRHLICLAFAKGGAQPLPVTADLLLGASLKAAIRAAIPDAPEGLARALGRMGERAWTSADYLMLCDLLACDASAKSVRHAAALTPEQVRALGSLPEPLRKARVGAFGLSAAQTSLLAETYALIATHQGEAAAQQAALRWGSAGTAKRLFEMVQVDVLPELPPHPFDKGTPRLRPLRTKAAVIGAAERYRNCMRDQLGRAAAGENAYFEWIDQPGAIVQVWRDPIYDWSLCEAKLARNAAVPAPQRAAIIAELKALGVHLGRSHWNVHNALRGAMHAGYVAEPNIDDVTWLFE